MRKKALWDKVANLKRLPCEECGNSFEPCQMDFDHLDPSTKIDKLSHLVKTRAKWTLVRAEIAKCRLLCALCHRLASVRGRDNGQIPAMAGKTHVVSDETRQLLSVQAIARWNNSEYRTKIATSTATRLTEESREIMSRQLKARWLDRDFRNKRSRPVIASKDGYETAYPSIKNAASLTGTYPGNICKVLLGQRQHTGGYEFRYAE